MAKDAKAQIDSFFRKYNSFFQKDAPAIVAKSAVEYFKGSFTRKAFDRKPWPALSKKYKPKRGSMMVRSSKLMNSIRDTLTTREKVVISAGNGRVPYARIHNEGGIINRAARSDFFKRNRYTKGKKSKAFGGMGLYKKGTTPLAKGERGLSFKAYQIKIPPRQFMGHSRELNRIIIGRFREAYKRK